MSTLHYAEHGVQCYRVLFVGFGLEHKSAVNTLATTAIQPSCGVVLPSDVLAFEALE